MKDSREPHGTILEPLTTRKEASVYHLHCLDTDYAFNHSDEELDHSLAQGGWKRAPSITKAQVCRELDRIQGRAE